MDTASTYIKQAFFPRPFDESLFQATIESVKDGIIVVGKNGRILYWNQQFVDMWEVPDSILASKDNGILLDFIVTKIKNAEAFMIKVLELYESPDKDFDTIIFKDGKIFERFSAPLMYSGFILGRVWSFKDVTEKKRLEAQLIQAQKMEAIGTLAAGVAHDFNSILMVIQGCTALALADENNSEQSRSGFKEIQFHVKTAADLIQQLLGFAGEGGYVTQSVDMKALMGQSVELFIREKKDITVCERYAKDLWNVQADPFQMEQVMAYLMVNAWQSMPVGGTITVAATNQLISEDARSTLRLSPGRYLKITVSDTGMGLDRDTQKRVFEPFFTSHQMGRGSGLGLATVYGIIKGHGGGIVVDSQKGEGTRFTFYLPSENQSSGDNDETSILQGTETILIIDDEDMVLDVGSAMLKKMGYHVLTAENGEEGIKQYEKCSAAIDLVILDMVMPKMSGKEIYDALRKINPLVKVILSSGYSLNDQASEIMECGCVDFIQKPFNMAQLSQIIKKALNG